VDSNSSHPLNLQPGHWYGWQEIGNNEIVAPFACTPVFLLDTKPLKTGKGLLAVSFLAAIHPIRPSRVDLRLRVVHRRGDCLVGTWLDSSGTEHTGIVCTLTLSWLEQHCHMFTSRFPVWPAGGMPEVDVLGRYLEKTFGVREATFSCWATETSFAHDDPKTFKKLPMPKKHSFVSLGLELNAFDSYMVRRGVIPHQMEDKWFMYCTGNSIHMRRSWTGYLVYEIKFDLRGDGMYLQQLLINRNTKQYSGTDDNFDKALALFLLKTFLLRLPSQYPTKEDTENQALEVWSQIGSGPG